MAGMIFLMCLLFVASTGYSAPVDSLHTVPVDHDSLKALKKRYRSKSTTETIISLPGWMAFLPLKIVFEGQKFIIARAFSQKAPSRLLDILSSDDGRRGISPTYSSAAGGGLKFYQQGLLTPDSKLSISATAGLRKRQQYQIKLRNVAFGRTNLQILAKYHFQPDESFYGLGPGSRKEDRTNYANALVTAQLDAGILINAQNRIGLTAGFDRNEISRGRNSRYPSTTEAASLASLPGIETESRMARLELEIAHDSRNHPGIPISGFEIMLRGGVFRQIDDDEFGFTRFAADISRYFHLFHNRTLKLRLAAEFTDTFGNRQIPFYYLSEIGRSETVRGFDRGRLRDKDMALGSVEYIYPIWEMIRAHLFFDTGTVAPNILKDFDKRNLKNGYGIAFSFRNEAGVATDFTIGHSRDGFRFYLSLDKIL